MNILRNEKYPNYVCKRWGLGLAIFPEGRDRPLKPIKGNKREVKFALSQFGRKKTVSFFEFLKDCFPHSALK